MKLHTPTWQAPVSKSIPHRPALSIRGFVFELILLGGLVLALGVPRWFALNRFVTTDEVLWLDRSGKFYDALYHGDFAATFQKSHPGVTVMWAGLTGYLEIFPKYSILHNDQNRLIGLGTLSKRDSDLPLRILTAGRQSLVLFSILILVLAFWFAQQLFDTLPALMGFLLIAFDPFHIALSRVLHLDGLLADLMLLSLLAFLVYLRERTRTPLLISALAAGLAWLTKSPSFFLGPILVLLLIFDQLYRVNSWREIKWKKFLNQTIFSLATWTLIGAAIFFVLWPAMWADPIGSVTKIFSDALGYAQAGHDAAIFFDGQIYPNGEIPSPAFYWITFLWRTTPVILTGFLSVVVLLFWKKSLFPSTRLASPQNFLQRMDRKTRDVFFLLLFAVGFILFMDLGLKKFDRYIVPAMVALDLIAGIGLVQLTRQVAKPLHEHWRVSFIVGILVLCVGVQVVLARTVFPYYFSYYNPLLGGAKAAQNVMQIGWGEGLDEAARYLNNKPNAKQLQVLSWYANGPFSYVSQSKVLSLDVDHAWSDADWNQFYKSDYIVIYIHQWQRDLPPEVLQRLRNVVPEYSVWIDGIEYVRIYKTPQE